MSKIKHITQSRTGITGVIKSPYLGVVYEPNIHQPIVYFTKPKNISQEAFDIVVDDILKQIQGLSQKSVEALTSKGENMNPSKSTPFNKLKEEV